MFILSISLAILSVVRKRRRYDAIFARTPFTTAFLSHEWGADLANRNHFRVKGFDEKLKQWTISTWFDSDRLTRDVMTEITAGIDKTKIVLLFLTKRYMEKVVGTAIPRDIEYCHIEFHSAIRRRGRDHILVIIMEPDLLDKTTWFGPVADTLRSALCIDFSTNAKLDSAVARAASEIDKMCESFGYLPADNGENLPLATVAEDQTEKPVVISPSAAYPSLGARNI